MLKPPPGTIVPAPKRSDRRRTEKQLRALSRPNVVPPLKRRGGQRKAAMAAAQRVRDNLATELESAAEAEQRAATEAQEREEAEAAAAARTAALRVETAQWVRENSERAAAEVAAATKAAADTAAAAEAARQAHSERARAQEIAKIERSIKTFRDEFTATHKRKPTAHDMQSAAYTRQRLHIERYNQLKHGIAPPSLRRRVAGMSRA